MPYKRYPKKETKHDKKLIKKIMKKVQNTEEEIYYSAWNNGNVEDGGITPIHISVFPQGTTIQSNLVRKGDIINYKRLELSYSLFVATTTNCLRVVIYKWLPDDVLDYPVVNSIFDNTYLNTAVAAQAPLVTGLDRKKFVILHDKIHTVSSVGPSVITKTINIKLRGKARYNGSAVTGSSQLYVSMISDDSTTAFPTYRMVYRVTATDP